MREGILFFLVSNGFHNDKIQCQAIRKIMELNMVNCPNCKSSNVRERNIGKKAGGVAGGVGGAATAAGVGAAAGAGIGSVVPLVGTAIGAGIGGLLGYISATVAGATGGAAAGSQLDGMIFDKYECRDCKVTFD